MIAHIETIDCREIHHCYCKDDVLAALSQIRNGDILKRGRFTFTPNENYMDPLLTAKGEPFKNGDTNCSKLIRKAKATPLKLWG